MTMEGAEGNLSARGALWIWGGASWRLAGYHATCGSPWRGGAFTRVN
jgi:hypothetical protein